MTQIKAYRCDECNRLVEKADNLMVIEKQGKTTIRHIVPELGGKGMSGDDGIDLDKEAELHIEQEPQFKEYRLEIRFFEKRKYHNKEQNGKTVDLCINCKKFISGAGKIDCEESHGKE
jgi:hypothetical protein